MMLRLTTERPYRGRFAPSPTGPLHAGSLVTALASWLDARACGGVWLVRIEDVDLQRCQPGMGEVILQQLASLGLLSDESVVYQSSRFDLYQAALDQLKTAAQVYRCYCSRKNFATHLFTSNGTVAETQSDRVNQSLMRSGIYPGTCREAKWNRLSTTDYPHGQYAYRVRTRDQSTTWLDRRVGLQSQNLAVAVGDFVIQRADGFFAYQLAVVVDDADQGITHIVRGEDLLDNTARQIYLQNLLGLPIPQYCHTPLVLAANGQKLSKQNGAQALDLSNPLAALNTAAKHLGLQPLDSAHYLLTDALAQWTQQWRVLTKTSKI